MRGHAQYGSVSHLQIDYRDEPTTRFAGFPGLTPIAQVADGPDPPPIPAEWPSLARVGEWVFGTAASTEAPVPRPFRVEPGSAVAAPVGPAGISTGLYDWAVVLAVTDDAAHVAQRYIRQLTANKEFGTVSSQPTITHPQAGVTVYEFGAESLGDADHHFQIVQRANSRWLLVTAYAQT